MISMPRLAITMTWAAQFAVFGPYLGTMLPNFAVQLTQIIGPLCGILVGPAIGVISDRSTHKWGRRRPLLVTVTIGSVICFSLMGWTREMGEALGDFGNGQPGEPTRRTWAAALTIFFYAWMDIMVNTVQTPTFLFISDFAGDRQTLGASIGQGWAIAGGIVIAGYIYIFGPAYHRMHRWQRNAIEEERRGQVEHLDANQGALRDYFTRAQDAPIDADHLLCDLLLRHLWLHGVERKQESVLWAGSSDYNKGVSLAGGSTDLMYNIVGYVFTWVLPFLVRTFGVKWVLVVSSIPQALLMVMAFTKVVTIDVIIVVAMSISQAIVFAILVPIIVHVMGHDIDIGAYVGALNSAQCFGQLLNFTIGSVIVETSLVYKLPAFLGGAFTVAGVFTAIFFKIKMHSM
ncbi:Glycoside-pentoside-hexuronide, partial [Globisporangium splendens]